MMNNHIKHILKANYPCYITYNIPIQKFIIERITEETTTTTTTETIKFGQTLEIKENQKIEFTSEEMKIPVYNDEKEEEIPLWLYLLYYRLVNDKELEETLSQDDDFAEDMAFILKILFEIFRTTFKSKDSLTLSPPIPIPNVKIPIHNKNNITPKENNTNWKKKYNEAVAQINKMDQAIKILEKKIQNKSKYQQPKLDKINKKTYTTQDTRRIKTYDPEPSRDIV